MSKQVKFECQDGKGRWSGTADMVPGESCKPEIIDLLKKGGTIYVRLLDEFIEPTEIK